MKSFRLSARALRASMIVCMMMLLALCSACATSFTGSAYVEGGAPMCRSMCQKQDLEFAGMVFMGAYTDGCICSAPGKEEEARQGAAEAAGGATGVVMQTRKRQQQQQQ